MRTNDRLHIASMTLSFVRKVALTIALAAGALVASSRSAQAQVPAEPVDPGVRCAAKVGTGQYEFYLPGERATDVNGQKWVCGPDGQWFRDYSSALTKAGAIGGVLVPSYSLVAVPRQTAVMR
jgi:hypothetical protein